MDWRRRRPEATRQRLLDAIEERERAILRLQYEARLFRDALRLLEAPLELPEALK